MEIRQHSIICANPHGTHRIAYTEWGNPDNPNVLVCVHGLTRNGRDFDFLAQVLSKRYRIICPDIVGRGRSDWLEQAEHYNYNTYITDMLSLLNQLGLKNVDWVGTSMGGIIGMLIAAQQPQMIKRLLLNDIGAVISQQALQRIGGYLQTEQMFFANLDAVETYLRHIHATFGHLSDEQWKHLAAHGSYEKNGQYYLAYDPKISKVFQESIGQDVELWDIWKLIKSPVMVLHGLDSDILTQDTLDKMKEIHSELTIVHCVKVGHAPPLTTKEQTDSAACWLLDIK
ncbi:alpha/beta hydrolase [Candidatus Albibeggiatoa sp. nov. BB20]|uniref:alpha/beta fold hydrolase n=1 Tax=Candidatus Albibeggiatoa sp. nov. BB20 TaxID=3162723 RepID=UPI00336544EB